MSDLQRKLHFGTSLMQRLCKETKENFVFSPLSLCTAFSMLVAGLDGDTKKEVLSLIGYENEEDLHAMNSELISNKELPVKIANKYLAHHEVEVKKEYSDLLKNKYESEVDCVNFKTNSDAITNDVNAWVSGKTNNMIKNLLSKGALTPDTVLVLLNAVYFKGTWLKAFDPLPNQMDFKKRDGSLVKKDFMKLKSKSLTYCETEQLKMVKIPYKEAGCYMVIAIPVDEAKHIDEVISEMSPSDMAAGMEKLNSTFSPEVELYMPKFKIEYTYSSLVDTMKALGTQKIFIPGVGDFSRLFSKGKPDGAGRGFFVSDVIHKATIEVDEKGTEAAAATAILMCYAACIQLDPPRIITFVADKAFAYWVNSVQEDILFQGILHLP